MRVQVYNTSPQFPVTVNHQLLRYFAAEFVVVEIMQARGADFSLVGRAQVPLYDLLGGKTRVQYSALPIRGNDGKAVGTLRVRALQPLSALPSQCAVQHIPHCCTLSFDACARCRLSCAWLSGCQKRGPPFRATNQLRRPPSARSSAAARRAKAQACLTLSALAMLWRRAAACWRTWAAARCRPMI